MDIDFPKITITKKDGNPTPAEQEWLDDVAKRLQAHMDTPEMKAKLEEEYRNLMIYGTTNPEMYK